eukprot:ANDGO_06004.mRNA.1 Dihydropteridine reductase
MQRVLCYGGAGALGRSVVEYLVSQSVVVYSVDVAANPKASHSVTVDPTKSHEEQCATLSSDLSSLLPSARSLDAVICVAGGWAGGNAASKSTIANTVSMVNVSLMTSVIAAHIATLFLRPGGLLLLTGSQAALGATPGMIGYGAAKAAVHQLVKSLAAQGSGLAEGVAVVGILPETLDTPANRAGMPGADFSAWTPCEDVAKKIALWGANTEERPVSGALVSVTTRASLTTWSVVA